MPDERKSILLRIPPELWEQIAGLAQRDLRSTNAQIEFLLREALRARGVGREASSVQERVAHDSTEAAGPTPIGE